MAIEDYRTYQEGGIYITGPIKLAKGGRGNISPTRRGNVANTHKTKPGQAPGYHASVPPGPDHYDCGSSDMKNILGYLNQGENLQTLSIGNIMQLQAFKLKDLVEEGKNELELTRESFILKLSHMAVSYFCYSTEIRFIL